MFSLSIPKPKELHGPVTSETLRHSLWGALATGSVVAVIGLGGALRAGAPFPAFLQPLLVFVVLAATVGGLTGPLVVPLARRALRRDRNGPPRDR